MAKSESIVDIIDGHQISARQWQVFALCFLVTLCDGFDTQAIAFTGPAIIEAFNLTAGSLAPILTTGIVGMVLGAMAFGLAGDKYGRRPMLLFAVLLFSGASLATAFANSTQQIIVWRFIAGLGMGGATPLVLAIAAEFCPMKSRGTVMTTILLGLPAGAILGGLLAVRVLPVVGWEGIFAIGGGAPLLLMIALYFGVPESPRYLARSTSARDQFRLMSLMQKITGLKSRDTLYHSVEEANLAPGVRSLFSREYANKTIAIWAVYFFNWVAWFMFLSWFPTVIKSSGFAAAQAPFGTVVVNTVFVVFAIPFATILPKVNPRNLLYLMFAVGIGTAIALANSAENWTLLLILAGGAAFGIGGQQLVLNFMVAQIFPTSLRATATGWAIGVGRTGAIVGSASGGWILERGGPSGFYLALIAPLLLSAMCLNLIKANRVPDVSSSALDA